ncbi:hypothetical protein [Chryseobacterium indologenes]|uniref:hypothetical protein n=1 Tax=Chryseobacterium indologenes TaxID=253 RepID=UPI000A5F1695|nr:hypothetical protein [Chryseobacterium indologenes]
MTTLTAIEQQFGFTYPKLYHNMQFMSFLMRKTSEKTLRILSGLIKNICQRHRYRC